MTLYPPSFIRQNTKMILLSLITINIKLMKISQEIVSLIKIILKKHHYNLLLTDNHRLRT